MTTRRAPPCTAISQRQGSEWYDDDPRNMALYLEGRIKGVENSVYEQIKAIWERLDEIDTFLTNH